MRGIDARPRDPRLAGLLSRSHFQQCAVASAPTLWIALVRVASASAVRASLVASADYGLAAAGPYVD